LARKLAARKKQTIPAAPIIQDLVGERRIYCSDCAQRTRSIEIGAVKCHEFHDAPDPHWKEKGLCELDP